MPEQSLKDKTVKGVAWSGIDNVVRTGVTFVVSIVLVRLLTPKIARKISPAYHSGKKSEIVNVQSLDLSLLHR